jgi:hypothetical protein
MNEMFYSVAIATVCSANQIMQHPVHFVISEGQDFESQLDFKVFERIRCIRLN